MSSRAKPAGRTASGSRKRIAPAASRPTTMAGRTPLRDADMALPGRQPIEALKNRAIGVRLEGAPILLDRRQILVDGNANVADGAAAGAAPARGRRPADRRRNARQVVLGQLGPWPRLDIGSARKAITSKRRAQSVNSAAWPEKPLGERCCAAHRRIPIVRAVPVGAWRSPVSAPVWGTGGREFKSRRPDQFSPSARRPISAISSPNRPPPARRSRRRRRRACCPAIGRADRIRSRRTWSGVSFGSRASSSAATPLAWAAATEVPVVTW